MESFFTRSVRTFRHLLEKLNARFQGNTFCHACGFRGKTKFNRVMWPDLINAWELSEDWVRWYDEREGRYCVNCHSSARTDQLSQAILSGFSEFAELTADNLKKACSATNLGGLKVAEINSAGTIHQFLKQLPGLYYSEYGSVTPGIRSENLLSLSYDTSFFDIVITSETLEHVPDFDMALAEIHRVLKPGGLHIFTIPVVWNRNVTRIRSKISDGKLEHILPPSYHGAPQDNFDDYLVFSEFGSDVVDMITSAGFEVDLMKHPSNPAMVCFKTRKKVI